MRYLNVLESLMATEQLYLNIYYFNQINNEVVACWGQCAKQERNSRGRPRPIQARSAPTLLDLRVS